MITKKIEAALNNQIALEAFASFYYLSMASWCDKSGFSGSAGFLYKHSEEEKTHMLKLFTYINEAGGHALTPEIKQPQHQFKSVIQIFELMLKHEIDVTKEINKLVELCLNEKDFPTFNFLQWYVAEQHEEEKLFKSILDKAKLIGADDTKGLYWLDKEIGSLTGSK